MHKSILIFAMAIAFLAAAPQAAAHGVALTFTGGTPNAFVSDPMPNTIGYQFTMPVGWPIAALGFYDSGQDGLLESHRVAIWNTSTQAMMAFAVVKPSDPLGSYGFRWTNIPTVYLPAGTYRIGAEVAVNGVPDDLYYNQASSVWMYDGIRYDGGFYSLGGFAYPDNPEFPLNIGDFGPNFFIVPEPGTLLLFGSGILGMVGVARRRFGK